MPTAAIQEHERSDRTDHESYRDLRERIVSGQLPPGSRLIESTLVKRLNANRYAVRFAIQRLEHEGLITRLPGGRARWEVAPLTIEGIREVTGIMSALHGRAGRMAARLDDEARRRLAAELREINDELRRAAGERPVDRDRTSDLDIHFHRCIVDAVAGERLQTILRSQEPVIERYVRSYMVFLTETLATSADEHEAIITAIEQGRPAAAQRAIEANWDNATERYAAVMEQEGERGTW